MVNEGNVSQGSGEKDVSVSPSYGTPSSSHSLKNLPFSPIPLSQDPDFSFGGSPNGLGDGSLDAAGMGEEDSHSSINPDQSSSTGFQTPPLSPSNILTPLNTPGFMEERRRAIGLAASSVYEHNLRLVNPLSLADELDTSLRGESLSLPPLHSLILEKNANGDVDENIMDFFLFYKKICQILENRHERLRIKRPTEEQAEAQDYVILENETHHWLKGQCQAIELNVISENAGDGVKTLSFTTASVTRCVANLLAIRPPATDDFLPEELEEISIPPALEKFVLSKFELLQQVNDKILNFYQRENIKIPEGRCSPIFFHPPTGFGELLERIRLKVNTCISIPYNPHIDDYISAIRDFVSEINLSDIRQELVKNIFEMIQALPDAEEPSEIPRPR